MEIDDLAQKAADVLHADGQHASLCFSPQRYMSQPVSSVLSAQRRIEDKMLKCKLNFETAISNHYHVESMHANDRRHLSAMTHFAVSDEFACRPVASVASRRRQDRERSSWVPADVFIVVAGSPTTTLSTSPCTSSNLYPFRSSKKHATCKPTQTSLKPTQTSLGGLHQSCHLREFER